MLASLRPRSFTGVPDLGETRQLSGSSSWPIIRPGHQEPFRRLTQTNPPTLPSMPLLQGSPVELLMPPNLHRRRRQQQQRGSDPNPSQPFIPEPPKLRNQSAQAILGGRNAHALHAKTAKSPETCPELRREKIKNQDSTKIKNPDEQNHNLARRKKKNSKRAD